MIVLNLSQSSTFWNSPVIAGSLGALIGILGTLSTTYLINRSNKIKEKIDKLEKLYCLLDQLSDYLNKVLFLAGDGLTCFKSMKESMLELAKIPTYHDPIQQTATEIRRLIGLYFKNSLSNPFGENDKFLNQVVFGIETICNVEKVSNDTGSEEVGLFMSERLGYFTNLKNNIAVTKREAEKITNKHF